MSARPLQGLMTLHIFTRSPERDLLTVFQNENPISDADEPGFVSGQDNRDPVFLKTTQQADQ